MSQKVPLIIEDHPEDYQGYDFITLIKFNDESFLNVVDNVCKRYIHAYVIDMCSPENISEENFINVVYQWYHTNSDRYPISLEFSKLGITEFVSPIFRSFPIDFVSRVIGPLPKFEMGAPKKTRKRKKKELSSRITVVKRNLQ